MNAYTKYEIIKPACSRNEHCPITHWCVSQTCMSLLLQKSQATQSQSAKYLYSINILQEMKKTTKTNLTNNNYIKCQIVRNNKNIVKTIEISKAEGVKIEV